MFDDVLGYLSNAADKPGRSIRGALSGNINELAALIPFSDSLGITRPEDAVSGSQLAKKWFGLDPESLEGQGAGFGLDIALDPLTYAGGFLGRLGGKAIGKAAEAAAITRGPGYKTGLEGLLGTATGAGKGAIEDLARHPGFEQALSEIPTGSQYLGHGAEATVFRAPDGSVTRVGKVFPGDPTRPIDPGVLPTTRVADFPGGKQALRVERSPYAPALPDLGFQSPELRTANDLAGQLAGRGIDFVDNHIGNVGLYQGRPVVIDSGAIAGLRPGELPLHAATRPGMFPDLEAGGRAWAAQGSPIPAYAPLVNPGPVDPKMRYLLDLIGGQSAMQRALAAGRSVPGYERTFGHAGMAAGAGLGAVRSR